MLKSFGIDCDIPNILHQHDHLIHIQLWSLACLVLHTLQGQIVSSLYK